MRTVENLTFPHPPPAEQRQGYADPRVVGVLRDARAVAEQTGVTLDQALMATLIWTLLQ